MNQRKLIGALSIVLLAIVFITIGCGDGKHRQSTNPRKTTPSGKRGAGDPMPGSKEAKEKSAALTQVQQELEMAMSGQSMSKLEDGDYTLDEIVSHAYFTKAPSEFALIRKSRPTLQGNTWVLNAEAQGRGVGYVANAPDINGREVMVPAKVSVSGGAIPARNQGSSLVFASKVVQENAKMKLNDQLPNPQNPNTEIAIVDILPSIGADSSNRNFLGQKQVSGNKMASVWILKASDGRIILKLSIDEGGQAGANNRSTVAFSRTMLFIYKVARASVPAATSAPAAPAASAAPAAPSATSAPAADSAPAAPAAPVGGEVPPAPPVPNAAGGRDVTVTDTQGE